MPTHLPAPRAPSTPRRLWLLACASLLSAGATAQTELAPVVVTATREAQPLSAINSDLIVIDARRIRDSSADSFEDLLRREAGVQLSRNGGPGQSASVLIRGSGAGSSVVLIDGVRVGSATLGQAALEALSLSQIERIEILRGPGSSLYGADAVGGVVQVFTRRGEAGTRVTAEVAVGGHGSLLAATSLSGASRQFDYSIGASHEHSDGVSTLRPGDQFGNFNPDRDGFRRNVVRAGAGWTPVAGHRIGVMLLESRNDAQYDASEFNPPSFAQDASGDFHSRLRSQVGALDYRGRVGERWTTMLKLARNDDESHAGATRINRYMTRRDQATWQNAIDLAVGQQLLVAAEVLDEQVEGTPFASSLSRHNRALVLGHTARFGSQVLQADVRHDESSVHGSVDTGRLGYSIQAGSGVRLRALAGTTFRAPTFNDLYFPGYGVASVTPERGRSLEVGLDWTGRSADASVTLFRNRMRDLIGYESDRRFCPIAPAYNFGCARNIERATLQGVHLSASQRLGALQLRAAVDLLDATNDRTGERLNRRAAHQERLAAEYRAGEDWSVAATLLHLGARPDGGATLARETTLDLRAQWRIARHWRIEAKLLNATDRDTEPVRDYQGLGRQGWIGVRYDAQLP